MADFKAQWLSGGTQSGTLKPICFMSALTPKADIPSGERDIR
jgi:hypothetical protein